MPEKKFPPVTRGAGHVVIWNPNTPDYEDGTPATHETTVAAWEELWKDHPAGWQIVSEFEDPSAPKKAAAAKKEG